MSSDERFLVALLEALDTAGLDAVVVGMTAAALHGAPVTTLDVDLLIRKTRPNEAKLERLCKALGNVSRVRASELAEIETLVGAAAPVDIIYDHLPGGLKFASVKSRSVALKLGGHTVRVASLADIIRSKRATDRPKDRAQLPILEETLAVATKLAVASASRASKTKKKR